MTLTTQYYNDGYLLGSFKGPWHLRLMESLKGLFEGSLKAGFTWESKYRNTLDLRPNVHMYDPSFVEVLLEARIPELLNRVVGPDLILFHTQVRFSFPGESYMDWHRDSYDYGQPIGNFPPAHKVIFYPKFDGVSESEKLKLCVGSHNRQFKEPKADKACLAGPYELPRVNYYASPDKFVLFNTALLHGAAADSAKSIRVIYSFLRKVQFVELYSDDKLHAEQVSLYERMLGI